MQSLQNKLMRVRDALVSVTAKTYHYRRPSTVQKEYIVWAEYSEDASFNADNRKAEQQIHGTIDYFTQKEFDPLIEAAAADYQELTRLLEEKAAAEAKLEALMEQWETLSMEMEGTV